MNITMNGSILLLSLLLLLGLGTRRLNADDSLARPRSRVARAGLTNLPPAIEWAGVTHQTLQWPGVVELRSKTSDADGKVVRVEYWSNGTNIATVLPPPLFPPPIPGSGADLFPFTFAPQDPGTYRLTGVSVDDLGATNSSPELVIRLNAPPELVVGGIETDTWVSPIHFVLPVTAVDSDGTIEKVILEYAMAGTGVYRTLGVKTSPPFDFEIGGFFGPPGTLRVSAWDMEGVISRQTVDLSRLRPAPGDDPYNPIRLSGDAEGLVVDLRQATLDSAEYQLGRLPSLAIPACYSFEWTAPSDRLVSVDTFGSTFDTFLQVNRVEAGKPQTVVGRNNDDPFRTPWSRLRFEARVGQTFQIYAFGNTNRDLGNLVLNFRTTPWTPHPKSPSPPNDAFANAQVLEANAPAVPGTTRGATGDLPQKEVPSGGTNSVWYQWTAPADGLAEVATTEVTGDTVVSVYTNPSRIVRGQNDDRSETDFSSRTLFRAQAGQVYFIQVEGVAPIDGDFKIRLRFPVEDLLSQPPAHDAFAQAAPLEGLFVSLAGTLVGATGDLNPSRPSVWWRWTSPVTGPVHATVIPWVSPVTIFPRISVLQGDTLQSLVPAPNVLPDHLTSDGLSPRRFLATAGTTYYLMVDDTKPGDFFVRLNAEMTPPIRISVPDIGSPLPRLRIQATYPQRVVVERSTDSRQWVPSEAFDVPIGTTDVTVLVGGPVEFYRVARP